MGAETIRPFFTFILRWLKACQESRGVLAPRASGVFANAGKLVTESGRENCSIYGE
jgi:hypothetical protein